MKKFVVLMLLFFSTALFSLPVGNPAFPKIIEEGLIFSSANKFSLRAGYEGNFVLDRKLHSERNYFNKEESFSIYLNSALLTFNLLNRLDLFGTYGKGKIESDWLSEITANSFFYSDLKAGNTEGWSCGTKIIFFEWGKINFSAGARIFYIDPEIITYAVDRINYNMDNAKLKYKEWQADMGLSYKTPYLVPYICAKYSKAKARLLKENSNTQQLELTDFPMKSKNAVGMAIGCTFSNNQFFMVTGEARFFDEEAYSISGELKF